MKKVILTILTILIVVPLVCAGIGYGYLSYKYRDVFMPGLSVNNVYTADMTIEEVNNKLKENLEIPEVTILNKDGESCIFSMSEADYDENYTADLENIRMRQTVMELVERIVDSSMTTTTSELAPEISYDEKKLGDYLDGLDFIRDNTDLYGKRIEIDYTSSKGYYLVDETLNLLNHDKAKEAVLKAVKDGVYEVDLNQEDCYEVPSRYTPSQKYALSVWEKLQPYMESEIVFDFSDRKVMVDKTQISKWLSVDEKGTFKTDEEGKLWLDEDAISDYIKELCDSYGTVNKPRTFQAHNGRMVTIEKGTYGSKIDYKAELEYLLENIGSGRHVERRPEYSQIPYSGLTGLNDIGTTYIEVDMSEQHLYYYVNGRLKLDSDVVTGNTALGRGTPERVCYVYFKQRNRVLHGEDYDTPVNYWMAVYNNIGIHDANWRGKFGGKIYQTNGSHGCVNTPIAKVKELYAMVDVGTPVLLYY